MTRNAQGRIGPGATMHCNHGPGTWRWEFVDWQPFTTVTHQVSAPFMGPYVGLRDEIDTFDFAATPDGGTMVVHRVRLRDRSRLSLLAYRAQRQVISAYWQRAHKKLLSVIADDLAAAEGEAR
jgi:hypothetical protein